MTAEEVIERLPKNKEKFGRVELEHLLRTLTPEVNPPKTLKVGDVIVIKSNKPRPAIIFQVMEDTVLVVPLSTTQDSLNLCETGGRFFGGQYFGKSILTVSKEYAFKSFTGTYDHSKSLNEAKKKLKLFLMTNL